MNIINDSQKATGSFYTCDSVTDYIAQWAINTGKEKILEPSFGDGQFINSAFNRFRSLGNLKPHIYGVELLKKPFEQFKMKGINIKGYCGDFIDYSCPEKVDAVIGNPPYISLKNLNETDRNKVFKLMDNYKIKMPTTGSLWMPFMIHSAEQIKMGGKLAFVLPYEITYVQYAFKLWEFLKDNFGEITIMRIHDDFFPEVDVETIIFLAAEKGKKTNIVNYLLYKSLDDLFQNIFLQKHKININEILLMQKPFETHLVNETVKNILNQLESNQMLATILNDCKFKIGYVSGNKEYFHPSKEIIKQYSISSENLLPCIINAKNINNQSNIGVDANNLNEYYLLFYPQKASTDESEYIKYGESLGVNKAYKCKTRSPWYCIPCVEVPDVILTVFGYTPRLMINSGRYVVSNSLLSGTMQNKTSAKELICRWYNSLTLLMIEMTIHSLGGGTLVFIPGEVDKLKILSSFPKSEIEYIFNALNRNMIDNGTESTYELGDEIVLKKIYKLSDEEILEIRYALNTLRSWRCPEERRG